MQAIPKRLLFFALALALSVLLPPGAGRAETVRQAVWAGRFYKTDPSALVQDIDRLTRKAQKTGIRIPTGRSLKAIIMPHAGYIYSGWTAAHAALVLPTARGLQSDQFSKVILLGPDHRIGFKNAAISDVTAYETPLGTINLHKDVMKLRRQPDLFQRLPAARDKERSLEVILPFLQRYLADFQLVPIMIGKGDGQRISGALDSIIRRDTLLVVSSDLSHFLAYPEAVARDRETIDEIINLKPARLIKTDNRACGKKKAAFSFN